MTDKHGQRIDVRQRRADRRHLLSSDLADSLQPKGDLGRYHPSAQYFDLATRLLESARREVLMVNGQFPYRKMIEFRNRIASLRKRSVDVSLLCHPDKLDVRGLRAFLERVSEEDGIRVRVSTAKVHGMVIADRRWVLSWNSPNDRHCLLLSQPAVVDPVVRMMDAVCEGAWDLDTVVRYHSNPLDGRSPLDDKTPLILALLGSGYKDKVAAREVGVSLRTYRRYVATLMERLDANSRFEAGVKAMAFGLVKPGDHQRRSPA